MLAFVRHLGFQREAHAGGAGRGGGAAHAGVVFRDGNVRGAAPHRRRSACRATACDTLRAQRLGDLHRGIGVGQGTDGGLPGARNRHVPQHRRLRGDAADDRAQRRPGRAQDASAGGSRDAHGLWLHRHRHVGLRLWRAAAGHRDGARLRHAAVPDHRVGAAAGRARGAAPGDRGGGGPGRRDGDAAALACRCRIRCRSARWRS